MGTFGAYMSGVADRLSRELQELKAEVKRREEVAFKAGWEAGYYDGGEHDCRMFTPTAERAWEEFNLKSEKHSGNTRTKVR